MICQKISTIITTLPQFLSLNAHLCDTYPSSLQRQNLHQHNLIILYSFKKRKAILHLMVIFSPLSFQNCTFKGKQFLQFILFIPILFAGGFGCTFQKVTRESPLSLKTPNWDKYKSYMIINVWKRRIQTGREKTPWMHKSNLKAINHSHGRYTDSNHMVTYLQTWDAENTRL